LIPQGTNKSKPLSTDGETLPRIHRIQPDLVDQLPRWKKILLMMMRAGTVVAGPVGVIGAEPAIAASAQASHAQGVQSPALLSTSVQSSIQTHFSPERADKIADEAIASQPPGATAAEKSEFRDLVHEGFHFVREHSVDLAKEVGKDLAKDAVKIYILAKIARPMVNRLRSRKNNAIAKRVADVADTLLLEKESHPGTEMNETTAAAVAGASSAEAGAALRLVGYELRRGIWVPLGVDET
jgi:hypothetical protein